MTSHRDAADSDSLSVAEPASGMVRSAMRETHCAWVFLVGDQAVKVKKPLDLGFVDWRAAADRRAACVREVELNRRFAPDVYRGVGDVWMGGKSCESVVVMRRMPDDRRLTTLVEAGEDVDGPLRDAARQLAVHHAAARRSARIDAAGSAAALRARWEANLSALERLDDGLLGDSLLHELRRLALSYVDGRGPLFQDRIRAGYVRDGHGDLLADDIFCLDDGVRILDCLEFDEDLRSVDAVDDAAVLAMDLERLGGSRRAELFMSAFVEFSGMPCPPTLIDHYIAYRAVMRAKIAMIKSDQGDAAAPRQALQLSQLGLLHLKIGEPTLTVVGGPPATGKSTVAAALSDRLGAVLVQSDRIRKELCGVDPRRQAAHDWQSDEYDVETTRRTYAEAMARAWRLLESGESVVVDASFSRGSDRDTVRAAARATHVRLLELRCQVSPEVATSRIERRWRTGDLSEATPAVAERMRSEFEDWPQAQVVDTSGTVTEILDGLSSVYPRLGGVGRFEPVDPLSRQ